MKQYKCHKIVSAARIISTSGSPTSDTNPLGTHLIGLDDGRQIDVSDMRQFNKAESGGYYVKYDDGYASFSPAKAFEEGYHELTAPECSDTAQAQNEVGTNKPVLMSFGGAIDALKAGRAVARAGWNGKGMFVYLVPANTYPASTAIAKEHFGPLGVRYTAYMAIKNPDHRVSTWAPSGSDALADDWMLASTAPTSE